MNRQAIVIVVISVIISVYISTRLAQTGRGTSLVVKSSCFDHQVTDFIAINGARASGVEPRGKGLYAAVLTKSLVGKYAESKTRSFHIGVLKITNFEDRLLAVKEFVERARAEKTTNAKQILVVFSIGTTHEKTVLEEIRNGIVAGKYEGAADVLKMYGMKKFLSMAHGCRQPYILIRDLNTATTLVERTGMCGGVLCAKA